MGDVIFLECGPPVTSPKLSALWCRIRSVLALFFLIGGLILRISGTGLQGTYTFFISESGIWVFILLTIGSVYGIFYYSYYVKIVLEIVARKWIYCRPYLLRVNLQKLRCYIYVNIIISFSYFALIVQISKSAVIPFNNHFSVWKKIPQKVSLLLEPIRSNFRSTSAHSSHPIYHIRIRFSLYVRFNSSSSSFRKEKETPWNYVLVNFIFN